MNMIATLLSSLLSPAPLPPPTASPGIEPLSTSFEPSAFVSAAATGAIPAASLTAPQNRFEGNATHSDWYVQVGYQHVTTRSSDGPSEDVEFDEGFAVPLILGKRFSSNSYENLGFAIELEGIYSDQEAENDPVFDAVRDITAVNVLLNGVADYSFNERFGIYAGGGIGVSFLDVGNESDNLSEFEDEDGPFLSWQLKAGAIVQATESLGIDIGYRFLNIDDVELDDTNGNADFDLQIEQHMVGVGFRFDL